MSKKNTRLVVMLLIVGAVAVAGNRLAGRV